MLVILSAGGHALANGRYPASSLVVFDPTDSSHLVVSTTFGLLESHDGGKSFLWRCEPAIGIADGQDPMVAITASGATVSTRADGIATSSDGCTFAQPPELAGKVIGDLALYRSQPHSLAAFSTSRLDGGLESQVVRADDDGRTWAALGAPLPADLLPLTIDVAPSDASRLYLTGGLGGQNQFSSALLRSRDGGATFESFEIPETTQHRLAYIAAVHPLDPDRVYLRVYDPTGTAVWITDDGGTTFRKVFSGTEQLFGFALSPNGDRMAFGGGADGIWVGAADGTNLTRRSNVRPTCLGWTADGLFACADVGIDRFSFGRSRDEAMTFEPLFMFSDLCGDTGCSPGSRSAEICAMAWSAVGAMLGATCGRDAGKSERDGSSLDASSVDGTSDEGRDVDLPADAPTVDEDVPMDSPIAGAPSPGPSGCGCTLAPSRPGAGVMSLVVLAGVVIRRRRAFPSSRPSKLV